MYRSQKKHVKASRQRVRSGGMLLPGCVLVTVGSGISMSGSTPSRPRSTDAVSSAILWRSFSLEFMGFRGLEFGCRRCLLRHLLAFVFIEV